MSTVLKSIFILLFKILCITSSSIAFADYYWLRSDGTYLRVDPSRASGWYQLWFSIPQVSPASIPSNVVWTWEAMGPTTGHWIGRVPQTPCSLPTQPHHRTDPELERTVKLQAEEAEREERLKQEAKAAHEDRVSKVKTALEEELQRGIKKLKDLKLSQETASKEAESKRLQDLKASLDAKNQRTKSALDELMCFTGETLVQINLSEAKPIELIRVGDEVLTCEEHSHTCGYSKVIQTYQRTTPELIHLSYLGKKVRVTPNHPYYTLNRGWVEARKLKSTDQLLSFTGESINIDSNFTESGEFLVYNLEVEGTHTYYACDALVHNCNLAVAGTVGAAVVATPGLGEVALGVGATVLLGQQALHAFSSTDTSTAPLDAQALEATLNPSLPQQSSGASEKQGVSDSAGETEVVQGTSRAPKQDGKPNSIHEQVDPQTGKVKSRTFYDEGGRPFTRQDFDHDHGGMQPHEHRMEFDAQGRPIAPKTAGPVPGGYDNAPTK